MDIPTYYSWYQDMRNDGNCGLGFQSLISNTIWWKLLEFRKKKPI